MRIIFFAMLFMTVALIGCREPGREQHHREMAVKLENNSARIRDMSFTLEGITTRLAGIEESLNNLVERSTHVEEHASASGLAPVAGSAELVSMSEQVASLAEELASMRQEMASTKKVLKETERRLSKPKDPMKAIHALLGKPDKFAEGLDRLLENVSAGIEDPAARQDFEAELLQLRDRVLNGYSSEELYQNLRARHIEKLNLASDERDRQAIQRGLSNLENCSDQELEKRLDQFGRELTLHEFFRIAKGHGLRQEDLAASFPALSQIK